MKRIMALSIIALAVAIPMAGSAATVQDYLDKASEMEKNEDYKGAINIYSAILEQFPKELPDVWAYRAEAYANPEVRSYKAAIADFDKALALDNAASPKDWSLNHARLFEDRAEAKHEVGDEKGAIADYTQLIALEPKEAFHYGHRADIENHITDCTAAVADFSSALELNEKPEYLWYTDRAIGRICLGDLHGAAEDYRTSLQLEKKDNAAGNSVNIHGETLNYWAVTALLGRKADADAFLAQQLGAASKPDGPDYEYDAARYFLGRADGSVLTRDAATDKARDPGGAGDFEGQANFYMALKQLGEGNKVAALTAFQKILATHRNYQSVEDLSHAWIKFIEGKGK